MTVLPTARPHLEAPTSVSAEMRPELEASPHPRLDRRRQRRRHRIEAALVVLALPLAVAATLVMLLTASGGSVLSAPDAAANGTVRIEGSLRPELADQIVDEGLILDVSATPAAERARTEVVYFSRGDRARAEELADAIGADVVVLGTTRPGGVTLVVRVGDDLAR